MLLALIASVYVTNVRACLTTSPIMLTLVLKYKKRVYWATLWIKKIYQLALKPSAPYLLGKVRNLKAEFNFDFFSSVVLLHDTKFS